jgi:hypothetical protein
MLLSDGCRSVLAQDGPEEHGVEVRVLAERQYRARKSHECDGCRGACARRFIWPGEPYTVLCVIEDGAFKVMKLCDGVYDGRR